MYVIQLSEKEQALIRECLENKGIHGEDLELAMNSKLVDLEELIGDGSWKNE